MLPPLPRCSRWAYSSLKDHPSVSAFPDSTFGSACTSTFSRIARRLLALRPAHSHGHQFRDRYPGASDISSPPCLPRLLPAGAGRRAGLAPAGKAPPCHGARGSCHSHPAYEPQQRLAKSTRSVPLEALATDKLWPKLFAEASGYQTVLIGLHQADMPHPHAGVALQGPIQLFRRPVLEPALNCALWMLDHQSVHRASGSSPEATIDLFETWLASIDPLQAWVARAAWFPEFDSWEDFARTPYENASTVDWFRSRTDDLAAAAGSRWRADCASPPEALARRVADARGRPCGPRRDCRFCASGGERPKSNYGQAEASPNSKPLSLRCCRHSPGLDNATVVLG